MHTIMTQIWTKPASVLCPKPHWFFGKWFDSRNEIFSIHTVQTILYGQLWKHLKTRVIFDKVSVDERFVSKQSSSQRLSVSKKWKLNGSEFFSIDMRYIIYLVELHFNSWVRDIPKKSSLKSESYFFLKKS